MAIEGRAKQAGPVGALLTWAGAEAKGPVELSTSTDIQLVRRDLEMLAEEMVQAVASVKEAIRDGVEWQWSTDIDSWCKRVLRYPDKFEPYRGHLPQWFHDFHTHLGRAHEAAGKELKQERRAQKSQHFVVLFMRLSALFSRVLRSTGCPECIQRQELQELQERARGLLETCRWWQFEEAHVAAVFKWAPFSESEQLDIKECSLRQALTDRKALAASLSDRQAAAHAVESQKAWDHLLAIRRLPEPVISLGILFHFYGM